MRYHIGTYHVKSGWTKDTYPCEDTLDAMRLATRADVHNKRAMESYLCDKKRETTLDKLHMLRVMLEK